MKQTTYEHEAELYANARDAAVTEWRQAHREDFAKMMGGVMADYHGEEGGFAHRMHYVGRLAADAAGFPSMAVWLNHRYPRQEAA